MTPTVPGYRKPPKRLFGSPCWVVPRCPYCTKGHAHWLSPEQTGSLVLPALCDRTRFYRVQETDEGPDRAF